MEIKSYIVSEADRIPKTQGLYAFSLDIVTLGKLGLLGRGNFSSSQLENAKNILALRLNKALKLFRNSSLQGTIQELNKRHYLRDSYNVEARECPPEGLLDDITSLPSQGLYKYIQIAKTMTFLFQPLYVGITKEQTLQERYFQHKSDHEKSNDVAKFGVRVRKASFEWDDLIFYCVEFPHSEENMEILSLLEKHLQALSRPLLSHA